eukprot:905606-Pleurochrysis_carterae.AAC.1
MLAGSASDECDHCDPAKYMQQGAAGSSYCHSRVPVTAPAAAPHPSKPGREKYRRVIWIGTRGKWKDTAKKHIDPVNGASMFTRDTCSPDC